MPYEINHNGVMRQFELIVPDGWQYWIQEVYSDHGRNGLPLLIMLHDRDEEIRNGTDGFLDKWPFHDLINDDDDEEEDRFFILVPYGFSYRAGNDDVPMRSWNHGLDPENLSIQNDKGAIEAMITAATALIQAEIDAIGISGPTGGYVPFDEDRIFLFGVGAGGTMAYRLQSEKGDYFAALCVIGAAYGGKRHAVDSTTVEYAPDDTATTYYVSLFAIHKDPTVDFEVPPGALTTTTGVNLSTATVGRFTGAGVPTGDAEDLAPSYRTLAGALDAYCTYNGHAFGSPDFSSTTEQTLDATTNSGIEKRWIPGAGVNPAVRMIVDPVWGTGIYQDFTGTGRYVTPTTLWQLWYKPHPRTS